MQNTVLPEMLYIFQDGKRESTDSAEWDNVSTLIRDQNFCPTQVLISEENKGLAKSIYEGVNYALKEYDAVIVLEDDCVPVPDFINFCNQGLLFYKNNESVYSINGWVPDVHIPKDGYDVFATRRVESCGWATWRNRWNQMSFDYGILRRILSNEFNYRELKTWGSDLESYFVGNIYGRCNSWATFWGLIIIENHGICISARKSLIHNIGNDFSGEHGNGVPEKTAEYNEDRNCKYLFPTTPEIYDECRTEYERYYEWYSAEYKNKYYRTLLQKWLQLVLSGRCISEFFSDRQINCVSIWGSGEICRLLVGELRRCEIHINSIIVSKPKFDAYEDIQVKEPDELTMEDAYIIVIPGYVSEKLQLYYDSKKQYKFISLEKIIDEILLDNA